MGRIDNRDEACKQENPLSDDHECYVFQWDGSVLLYHLKNGTPKDVLPIRVAASPFSTLAHKGTYQSYEPPDVDCHDCVVVHNESDGSGYVVICHRHRSGLTARLAPAAPPAADDAGEAIHAEDHSYAESREHLKRAGDDSLFKPYLHTKMRELLMERARDASEVCVDTAPVVVSDSWTQPAPSKYAETFRAMQKMLLVDSAALAARTTESDLSTYVVSTAEVNVGP